jgi:Rrf2 family protein
LGKVLNISEAATIAIHSMALIAKSSSLLGAQEISDITGFPRSHISKVLSQLTKNRYLDSIRGPGGGFQIRGSSGRISLMDIYRLFDGEIQESTNCRMNCESCPFGDCIFGGLAKRFSREFEDYLQNHSLASII